MQEINMLKQELARVRAEDQMIIESLKNRLREVENELQEYRQIAECTQVVRYSNTNRRLGIPILNDNLVLFSDCFVCAITGE